MSMIELRNAVAQETASHQVREALQELRYRNDSLLLLKLAKQVGLREKELDNFICLDKWEDIRKIAKAISAKLEAQYIDELEVEGYKIDLPKESMLLEINISKNNDGIRLYKVAEGNLKQMEEILLEYASEDRSELYLFQGNELIPFDFIIDPITYEERVIFLTNKDVLRLAADKRARDNEDYIKLLNKEFEEILGKGVKLF